MTFSYCVICDRPGQWICPTCTKQLIPHPEVCIGCGSYSPYGRTCSICQPLISLDGVIICFHYSSIKRLIHLLKYRHGYIVADFLCTKMSLFIQSHPIISMYSHYSFVPMHPRRQFRERGFNQSLLLSRGCAKITRATVVSPLHKVRLTRPQAQCTKKQRLHNLHGSFQYTFTLPLPHLLLFDDVTTTGSTLNETAKEIKKYMDIPIRGIVVAKNSF